MMVQPTALRKMVRSAALAGAVPPAIWKRLPASGTFRVPTTHGGFGYHAPPGDGLARNLHWRGIKAYEAETLSVFERLARRGGTVIDIGANTGLYSLLACAASPQVRVIAFEPVPRLYEHLRRNVELNGWGKRIELHDSAVSDASGTADFVLPRSQVPTSAHLSSAAYRSHEGAVVTVPVARLDDVDTGDDVRLIKIDVEGAEDKVLAGMPKLLSQQRPDIVIECLPEGPFREVERLLEGDGYHFFHLLPSGPSPVAQIKPDHERKFRNFLCSVGDPLG